MKPIDRDALADVTGGLFWSTLFPEGSFENRGGMTPLDGTRYPNQPRPQPLPTVTPPPQPKPL